ncbi:TIR domain-containing protein [Sulfurimonas aquatica]|uniref:TIR domain-containing protein n=1 Tax=Sulfurimonas aquatica TaxID=2672570 RepID=A0A975B2D8_9BACT|nr:TIR domain-containing protein [Sulfurimonas aquatica]QSZ42858.1 TIR domain-containing protein [Sulfurimonas aquatica]
MSKKYKIFMSHSWTDGDIYDGLEEIIKNEGIEFQKYSIAEEDPVHVNGTEKELASAIEKKIKESSCLVIMAGKYFTYSKWINKEIELAKVYKKPIIAIRPWTSSQTSTIVQDNSDEIIHWQAGLIANTIRKWG